MNCPNCCTSLNTETFYGETIDRCPACGGLWLDPSELREILDQYPSAPNASVTAACVPTMACPKCTLLMTQIEYAHDSGVLLNRCPTCQGVWLERGQLDRLAKYREGTPATRNLGEALADEMRAANRIRLARDLLRSRVLSSTVALVYLLLMLWNTGRPSSMLSWIRFVSLPLLCIWFPDVMGNVRGISFGLGRPVITQKTPGDFVAIGGWLLLFCPVWIILIQRLL